MAAALALAVAGCGGDEEDPGAGDRTTGPETARERTRTTETTTGRPRPGTEGRRPPGTETSPEDQPGGAGDEEPARSQAVFTGRAGVIGPRAVRVPAYIAIRVELRSADGRAYALRFDGKTVRARRGRAGTVDLAGMRPGKGLTGIPVGGRGTPVRVEATAEPGP